MTRKAKARRLMYILGGAYATLLLFACCIRPVWKWIEYKPIYQATSEAFIDSLIPDAAMDVYTERRSVFQGVRTYIRFTLPSEALDAYFGEICPGEVKLAKKPYNFLYNIDDLEWWRPADVKIFTEAECIYRNVVMYRLLIDKANPDWFVIYLNL